MRYFRISIISAVFLFVGLSVPAAGKTDYDAFFQKEVANADLLEERLITEGYIYGDEELEQYLQDVLMRVGGRILPLQRLHVLRDPSLNAMVVANDVMYINLGLLARLETEDQLAFILAHELTHIRERHVRKEFESIVKKVGVADWVGTVGTIATREADYIVRILTRVGVSGLTMAVVNGFSRDLEREADKSGLSMVIEAGYDPRSAIEGFDLFMREYGDQYTLENLFYGSHPRNRERKRYLSRLVSEGRGLGGRSVDRTRFLRFRTPLLKENARLNIEWGRPLQAIFEVKNYIENFPYDKEARLLLARAYSELHRDYEKTVKKQEKSVRRGAASLEVPTKEEAYRLSEKIYKDLLSGISPYPEAYKGYGDLLTEAKRYREALEAYERYLKLQPATHLKRYIKWKMGELNERIAEGLTE